MSVENRKIDFYSFSFQEYKNKESIDFWDEKKFDLILKYIESLPMIERLVKDEKSKKSYYLSDIVHSDTSIRCLKFKSCKFGHCPPIMDSDTANERPTDKRMNEGEQENTHLAIRLDDCEGFVALESRKSGISMGTIVRYFNAMMKAYFSKNPKKGNLDYSLSLFYSVVPIKNFDKALEDMTKLKIADIYIDKNFIGSELSNIVPDDDPFIKNDLILTLKSERGENILVRTVKRLYSSLANTSGGISRIRIHGTNTSGAKQILDSDLIRKTQNIEAKLNANGLISTESIFSKLIDILRTS